MSRPPELPLKPAPIVNIVQLRDLLDSVEKQFKAVIEERSAYLGIVVDISDTPTLPALEQA